MIGVSCPPYCLGDTSTFLKSKMNGPNFEFTCSGSLGQ